MIPSLFTLEYMIFIALRINQKGDRNIKSFQAVSSYNKLRISICLLDKKFCKSRLKPSQILSVCIEFFVYINIKITIDFFHMRNCILPHGYQSRHLAPSTELFVYDQSMSASRDVRWIFTFKDKTIFVSDKLKQCFPGIKKHQFTFFLHHKIYQGI